MDVLENFNYLEMEKQIIKMLESRRPGRQKNLIGVCRTPMWYIIYSSFLCEPKIW